MSRSYGERTVRAILRPASGTTISPPCHCALGRFVWNEFDQEATTVAAEVLDSVQCSPFDIFWLIAPIGSGTEFACQPRDC